MKIALTQACLKVKCYFCFSIVADNVILATDTTKTKFWRKFFGRLFSKRCGTMAVLCGQYYITRRKMARGKRRTGRIQSHILAKKRWVREMSIQP